MNVVELTPNSNAELTMSTVEIAELTGKRHDNVMRAANQLKEGGIICAPQIEERYGNNNSRMICRLNKTESLNLVARLSPEFTARIIDRWMELENQQIAQLESPAWLRGTLLQYTEKVIALENRVDALLPSQKALERIAEADGSMCITDTAKALQMRPKDLFVWLRVNGWIYKRPGTGHFLGYQTKTAQCLLEHKVTTVLRADGSEKVTEQVRVTPKGLAKIAKYFETEAASQYLPA